MCVFALTSKSIRGCMWLHVVDLGFAHGCMFGLMICLWTYDVLVTRVVATFEHSAQTFVLMMFVCDDAHREPMLHTQRGVTLSR